MSFPRRLFSTSILAAVLFAITSRSVSLAETQERYVTLDADGSQSFANLVQQAEDLAKESIGRSFLENPGLTEITRYTCRDAALPRPYFSFDVLI